MVERERDRRIPASEFCRHFSGRFPLQLNYHPKGEFPTGMPPWRVQGSNLRQGAYVHYELYRVWTLRKNQEKSTVQSMSTQEWVCSFFGRGIENAHLFSILCSSRYAQPRKCYQKTGGTKIRIRFHEPIVPSFSGGKEFNGEIFDQPAKTMGEMSGNNLTWRSLENPPFLQIGNTSSFMVDVPASHASFFVLGGNCW